MVKSKDTTQVQLDQDKTVISFNGENSVKNSQNSDETETKTEKDNALSSVKEDSSGSLESKAQEVDDDDDEDEEDDDEEDDDSDECLTVSSGDDSVYEGKHLP